VRAIALAAATVFVASCWLAVGGLATTKDWGDVGHYEDFGRRILDGEVPYDDFYVEYPPLALPTFVVPALMTDDQMLPHRFASKGYQRAFKLQMAAFGLTSLLIAAWILARLRRSRREAAFALGAIALSPLVLGHVFLNRYDAWPALLGVAALAALLARRSALAGALLAIGFAAKIFAAAVVPVAAIRLLRTEGRSQLARAAVAATLVALVCFGVFAVVAFGGIGFSYWSQARRQLQIESLGSSLLLVADQFGLYSARIVAGAPGSIDLAGTIPDVVALLSTLVQVGAVVGVTWLYLRGPESEERLVTAYVAAVTAFLVFAKVLSPQYLVWLVPLVPLVGGLRGRAATATLLAALGLTQLELQGYVHLSIQDYAVWSLVARNVLLVLLVALLVDALRPTKTLVR
jgi:uncharacterized membrane protein